MTMTQQTTIVWKDFETILMHIQDFFPLHLSNVENDEIINEKQAIETVVIFKDESIDLLKLIVRSPMHTEKLKETKKLRVVL